MDLGADEADKRFHMLAAAQLVDDRQAAPVDAGARHRQVLPLPGAHGRQVVGPERQLGIVAPPLAAVRGDVEHLPAGMVLLEVLEEPALLA